MPDKARSKRIVAALVMAMQLPFVPQAAFAGTILVQTVDLSEMDMSSEGGEAKLFRLTNSGLGRCKIEAVHYGEMGRTTYRFIFDSELRYAAMREYAYAQPIATSPNVRMTLRREVLLASSEGAQSLPGEFSAYKGYFESRNLVQCAGGRRR